MFALRAGRVQVAFAVGAKVETRANAVSALRAGIRQGLAHQKVDDETDEAPGRKKNNDQNGPEGGAHPASRSVAIHVGDEENHDRHTETYAGYDSCQSQ